MSQCPDGHSLFFHLLLLTSPDVERVEGLNALTGILCFSTEKRIGALVDAAFSLNALTGILCFSTRYAVCSCIQWNIRSLNALTGILCFSTAGRLDRCATARHGSQCPDGHSLFFHG